jgi:hypothetical protein
MRPWARVAYWTRSSLSAVVRSAEISWTPVECCRSLKSTACSTEFGTPDVVLAVLLTMKLSKNM